MKSAYLQAFYDCEGCIYHTTNKKSINRWRITIEQWKISTLIEEGEKFMKTIQDMLEEFDISISPVRQAKKNYEKMVQSQ